MRLERRTLTGDPAALVAELRELVPGGADVADTVAKIVAQVGDGGDAALERFRRELDDLAMPVRVSEQDVRESLAETDPAVRVALDVAIANVRAVAEAGVDGDREVTLPLGQQVRLREQPVRRAAVYVPGGRASYPSTVVMGVVTAKVAGVREVVVATPSADPFVLAACSAAQADEIYVMGGAHAIAALACGTETIAPVDVIVGPGNLYVQEAKRQVAHLVGIDGFAGPSDLLAIVTDHVALAALDLRAQGEHGADSLVVAVSPDEAILDALEALLAVAPEQAPCALVHVRHLDAALAFAEEFAPEHLQLLGTGAEALAPRITRAGCLFVGAGAATAFGDYVAGSNHVLPTDGAARFASGLSARTFRRRMAEVRIPPEAAAKLAPAGAAIARAEGFEVHAKSMEARIRENGER